MPDTITGSIPFSRVPISPLAFISEAWGRVKGQYWLFLGITLVGLLLGSVAPMGILLGPMMCGIFLCYRELGRGLTVRFETLFKGFDFFAEALIASLLMLAASLVVVLPLIALVIGLMFMGVLSAVLGSAHNQAAGAFAVGCLLFGAAFLLVLVASLMVGLLFTFTYPLMVDRGLKGLEAVKLSFRASLANFWGLLGLGLTLMVMSLIGVCFCYVGALLVLPITYGAQWIAYERVFGLGGSEGGVAQLSEPRMDADGRG